MINPLIWKDIDIRNKELNKKGKRKRERERSFGRNEQVWDQNNGTKWNQENM